MPRFFRVATHRRPTSRTKARTSRQGLPIDEDDGDDQGLIDATVLARPALAVVVGPAVPVTGGDVVGDPWKSVTLGQGEGGESLDTHPAKARKGKGERVKLTPPLALEPEPWKRVENTSNEHNSAPGPSPAVGFVNEDTDGVEAHDILPLLRQLRAATPNGDLGSGKASQVHEQEVWTCGQNSYGELGHSDTGTRKVHCLVKTFAEREVIDVAAGERKNTRKGIRHPSLIFERLFNVTLYSLFALNLRGYVCRIGCLEIAEAGAKRLVDSLLSTNAERL